MFSPEKQGGNFWRPGRLPRRANYEGPSRAIKRSLPDLANILARQAWPPVRKNLRQPPRREKYCTPRISTAHYPPVQSGSGEVYRPHAHYGTVLVTGATEMNRAPPPAWPRKVSSATPSLLLYTTSQPARASGTATLSFRRPPGPATSPVCCSTY